jgi:hypothetical protein
MTARIVELQADETPVGGRIVQNISWLTLAIGATGAAVAFALRRPDWSKGIVVGAILGWLNFRWLKRGVTAVLSGPTGQATPEKRRHVAGSAVLALFRYALIGIPAHVILFIPVLQVRQRGCAFWGRKCAASMANPSSCEMRSRTRHRRWKNTKSITQFVNHYLGRLRWQFLHASYHAR